MKHLPLDKRNQKYQPYKQFLPGCEFSAMSWWLLCSIFDNFLRPTETSWRRAMFLQSKNQQMRSICLVLIKYKCTCIKLHFNKLKFLSPNCICKWSQCNVLHFSLAKGVISWCSVHKIWEALRARLFLPWYDSC